MKAHAALLLVAVMLAPAVAPAAGQLPGIVPDAPAPEGPSGGHELPPATVPGASGFAQGSAGYLERLARENAASDSYKILYESFESGSCGALPAGWAEETRAGRPAAWRVDCFDRSDYAAGRPTAIVHSGVKAASIRDPAGGYPARTDTRLVSPVVDLRYVAGASADPNAITDQQTCEEFAANATLLDLCEDLTSAGGFPYSRESLHALLGGIRDDFKGFGSGGSLADLRTALFLTPDDVTDVPLTPERLGFGLANLSFWHSWDWKTADGGLVEIRYEREDGSWSEWRNLEGDLVFETRVRWADTLQETGCAAWVDLEDGNAPLPEESLTTVMPAICGGISYWTNVAGKENALETEETGSLAAPGISLSALYSQYVERREVTGPNGRVDVDGNKAVSGVYYDPTPDPEGYVGEEADMSYSKYTLNRFIGTRVQVAFRAFSGSEVPSSDRGWFVDDVEVAALVPTHDVGIVSIEAPKPGDVVNGAQSAITPKALIQNFGRERQERINVTFEILNDEGVVVWGPYRVAEQLTLEPQERRLVSPPQTWRSVPGVHELRVTTHVDLRVGAAGPNADPDVNPANDQAKARFLAQDVPKLTVHVLVDEDSVQTDLGGSKAGKIRLENTGNIELSGTLRIYYDETSSTGFPPTRLGSLTPIAGNRTVDAIPFGRNISSQGAEKNYVDVPWTWNQRAANGSAVTSGIYSIVATFTPVERAAPAPQLGLRTGESFVFVRATPPASLLANFTIPSATKNTSPCAVASAGGALCAYAGSGWTDSGSRLVGGVTQVERPDGTTTWTGIWESVRPAAPDGTAIWSGTGEDCRRSDDANCPVLGGLSTVDWSLLRKDLTSGAAATQIPADATSLSVSFKSEGRFDFHSDDVNRTRGFVRLVPQEMHAALDAARARGGAARDELGLPGKALGDSVRTVSTTHPCGRLEDSVVTIDGAPFNVRALYLENPHRWTSCQIEASFSFLGSRNVAVEWIFEMNRTRLANHRQTDPWCNDSSTAGLAGITCPLVAPTGQDRWYLDAIQITARGPTPRTWSDSAEVTGAGATSSRAAFFGCTYATGLDWPTSANCRGWIIEGGTTGSPTANTQSPFPSNWWVERTADVDGTGHALRYGVVTAGELAASGPGTAARYGIGDATSLTVLSKVESPSFALEGLARPALSFWLNFTLSPCRLTLANKPTDLRVPDGVSAWIVARKAAPAGLVTEERRLLVPEGGYTHRILTSTFESAECDGDGDAENSRDDFKAHPYAPLYEASRGNNVWGDISNPTEEAQPRWFRAEFDLSAYTAPEWDGYEFSVELQVVAQSIAADRKGFLRVDDFRVEDRVAANDVGILAIESPPPGRAIGPGQNQTLAARVGNSGLFDQDGVAVRFEVWDSTSLVFSGTTRFSADLPLPGLLSGQSERNLSISLPQNWMPTREGRYTIVAYTALSESVKPFADTNPLNDRVVATYEVVNLSSVRVQPRALVPDEFLVTPVVGGVGEARTIRVPIENVGTLPAIYQGAELGQMYVLVTIRDEDGLVALESKQIVGRLDVGRSLVVEFQNAWLPDRSGLFTVDMELVVLDADGDEVSHDNLRRLKVIVFNRIVPAGAGDWGPLFAPEGGWAHDENRTGGDGYTFGSPYANLANDTLTLSDLVNLRSMRNIFLVLDHRYAFEEGYDGGLVELSADGGVTWHPVPPRNGYPVNLSTASPLVDDPFAPIAAFTGFTDGFTTVDIDLGAVEALRSVVPLVKTDFVTSNPFTSGTSCVAAAGEKAPAGCLRIAPPDGSAKMWFSDKYAPFCTRSYRVQLIDLATDSKPSGTFVPADTVETGVTFPRTIYYDPANTAYANRNWTGMTVTFGPEVCKADWGGRIHEVPIVFKGKPMVLRWTLIVPSADSTSGWTASSHGTAPVLESVKKLTFDVSFADAAPSDRATLSFSDWRAIGQTVQARQASGGREFFGQPVGPNTISAHLLDDSGALIADIIPFNPSGQDHYRDWTANEFPLDDYMPRLAGRTAKIEFRHYVAAGFPNTQFGGLALTPAQPGDTDFLSPHFGWAIDNVRLSLADGRVVFANDAETEADLAEGASQTVSACHNARVQEGLVLANCPRIGSPTASTSVGWTARGPALGNDVWRVAAGELVAKPTIVRPTETQPPASGLAPQLVGQITGDDSRLTLPLDLKSAVGETTLEFETAYKFTLYNHKSITSVGAFPYAASGGRVELSLDDGVTWIALTPVPPPAPLQPPQRETYCRPALGSFTATPFGGVEGDPQQNSPFGHCSEALSGRSDAWPTKFVKLQYDLTPFAGREVLLGFHAFFTTNREVAGTAVGTGSNGHDMWRIRNLSVNAAILDANDLALRFRAASDGSVGDEGWDLRDVVLLGVKHSQNLGVRALPPLTQGLVRPGPADLRVEIVNKGQVATTDARLVVWVNATDPTYSQTFGPAPLSRFGACGETTALEGGRLAAESSAVLCTLDGAKLTFPAEPGVAYKVTAVFRDAPDQHAADSVKADNRHVVDIPATAVLAAPEVRFASFEASPNAFNPARDAHVTVAAVIENRGLDRAGLQSVRLKVVAPDGTEEIVLPDVAAPTLLAPLARATVTWTLDDVLDPARGRAGWRLVGVLVDAAGTVREAAVPLYVGEDKLADLGFDEHVQPMTLTIEQPQTWYTTSSACGGETEWFVQEDTSGGYTNNTARWAFALPRQIPPPAGDGAPAAPCAVRVNALRTPRIALDDITAPDGSEHLWLTFWSRHSFVQDTWGRVEIVAYNGSNIVHPNLAVPKTSVADLPKSLVALNFTDETPGYGAGRFVPVSIDLLQVIRNWQDPAIGKLVRESRITHIEVWFDAYGEIEKPWQIDDVSLSPLGAEIGPAQSYPALDDTDKEYRFVVRNAGSYTEDFALSVTDPFAGKATIPSGWHVVLLDEQDRVVWYPGAAYTPAPPGCNPVPAGPTGQPVFASSIRVDPGESHVVRAKICIPISETQAGRSGDVAFGITATALANTFHRVTTPLTLSYSYAERANLVIPAGGVRVDNPDLPVDQPRTVTVTVFNAGLSTASNVAVRVVDTMDKSYGYTPITLTGVDGKPAVALKEVPVRDPRPLSFLWTPRAVGEHNLTVMLDPLDRIRELKETDNVVVLPIRITRAEYPDLVVTLDSESLTPARGEPNELTMRIENRGGKTARSVELTFKAGVTDLLIHEGAAIDDMIERIEPGQTIELKKSWRPAVPGTIRIIAGALPKNGVLELAGTQGDNYAELRAKVYATDFEVALPAVVEAAPSASIDVPLKLLNPGQTDDDVVLVVNGPAGVLAILYRNGVRETGVALPKGENVSLTLDLELPARIVAGDHPLTVTARSVHTGAVHTGTTTLRVNPVHALGVEAAPFTSRPGTVVVPATVRNDGNAAVWINVSAPSLPAGWSMTPQPVRLAPYSSGVANLTFLVPGSEPTAVYEVLLVAAVGGAVADGTLLLEIAEHEALQPTIEGRLRGVRPGELMDLALVVANEGNVRGEGAVRVVAPAGWTVRLGRGLVALDVGREETLPLSILVPKDATAGRYDLRVEVAGLRSNLSTVERVVVSASDLKVADLTFTPRVNVAPGTIVTFNASIVNEGLTARNVTVAFYADDFLIGVEKLPLVTANATSVGFRWEAQPGEHVLLLLVDPGNVLKESDEANNARLEVIRTTGEEGILGAARKAVPSGGLLASLGVVAVAALAVARRRK